MFALPGPFPYGGLFRCQVIHIGASFKELEGDLPIWLGKFEAVLRRLFWFSARLHMDSWMGSYRFEWSPEDVAIERMMSDRPVPVSHWRFHTDYPINDRYFPGKEVPESKNSSTQTSRLWDRELDAGP